MDVLSTWAHALLPSITNEEWAGTGIAYGILFIVNRMCKFIIVLKGWDKEEEADA